MNFYGDSVQDSPSLIHKTLHYALSPYTCFVFAWQMSHHNLCIFTIYLIVESLCQRICCTTLTVSKGKQMSKLRVNSLLSGIMNHQKSENAIQQNSVRNPVLLIHGLTDTTLVFRQMTASLIAQGLSVHSFNLTPNNGAMPLEQLAVQVADYVAKTFHPTQPLDLIGFSMGGIVSRYYIQRLGGIEQVQRFISISAPNNGTLTGYLSGRPGCAQMRPGSPLLRDLNQDSAMLARLNFTVIWTPFDLMIVPPSSSQMPVGKEVIVQAPLHSWMLADGQCLKAVTEALSEPVLVASC